jgi:hypothetical protein
MRSGLRFVKRFPLRSSILGRAPPENVLCPSRDVSLYHTSHHVMLPCRLVWQEAVVGMLGTSRSLRDLPL